MSATERDDLLGIIEHRTTLDRPNFEHFTIEDLRRIALDFDEGPFDAAEGMVVLTTDELDRLVTRVSRTAGRAGAETASDDDTRSNATDPPRYIQDGGRDTDSERALSPAEIRAKKGAATKADRFNAAIEKADVSEFDPDSAANRILWGYPPTPELVSEAVSELRNAGRDDDARRIINEHPGLWAAGGGDDGEDHSDLDPAQIRQNATGETDTEGWTEGDDPADLAPQHPWLDISEWDVKRERDDLDGDES